MFIWVSSTNPHKDSSPTVKSSRQFLTIRLIDSLFYRLPVA